VCAIFKEKQSKAKQKYIANNVRFVIMLNERQRTYVKNIVNLMLIIQYIGRIEGFRQLVCVLDLYIEASAREVMLAASIRLRL